MADIIAETHLTNSCVLRLVQGDLTLEKVDAIVNAANSSLVHGGGLAAAVVKRGGSVIQKASNTWVNTRGQVTHRKPAITIAGDLSCEFVIHAVGPVWGSGDEDQKLKDAITGVLELALTRGFTSLAIPAISTGIYRFPRERAAGIIFETIEFEIQRREQGSLQEIRVTILGDQTLQDFHKVFTERWPEAETRQ